MSAEPTPGGAAPEDAGASTSGEPVDDRARASTTEQRVEDRAEAIVERASEQVAHFARRLIGRAREEVEDIIAEAQTIRRGDRQREE
jgi:hypothetical protein